MNIKLIIGVVSSLIPKIIGLSGYKDSNKTGTLSALKDGSKFTTFVVIVATGVIMLLPVEVRETIFAMLGALIIDSSL